MVATGLILLGLWPGVSGPGSFAAVLGGLILMATALTCECPLYRLLHITTQPHRVRRDPIRTR
jgi:hypothetical protein